HGAVLGHKQRSPASHPAEGAEDATTSAELSVRGHLDRTAHPGKFSSLGDDGIVRIQRKLEDRHGGAYDAALHNESSCRKFNSGELPNNSGSRVGPMIGR